MLNWTLQRLVVDKETAEEVRSMAGLDEFHSQFEERARGWTEGWLAEGREEGIQMGIELGRAQGIAAQRKGLRRQAVVRFGASARILEAPLKRVESSARLAKIGEWLMVYPIDRLFGKIEFDSLVGSAPEQWKAKGRKQGIETGIERGRAEGVAAQREGLRRQAALRFGASAGLLDAPLERVGSAATLTEISVWLMVDTIDRLVAKVEAAAEDDRVS